MSTGCIRHQRTDCYIFDCSSPAVVHTHRIDCNLVAGYMQGSNLVGLLVDTGGIRIAGIADRGRMNWLQVEMTQHQDGKMELELGSWRFRYSSSCCRLVWRGPPPSCRESGQPWLGSDSEMIKGYLKGRKDNRTGDGEEADNTQHNMHLVMV